MSILMRTGLMIIDIFEPDILPESESSTYTFE